MQKQLIVLSLCSLSFALTGCQTVPEQTASAPTRTISETVVNPESVDSEVVEAEAIDEASLYDLLAIVRELGEAVDSPRLNADDESGEETQSVTVLVMR